MPGKLLKILSGPHLGAEVEVGDTPLTLGSGEGCDIIIDDRLAGERHLTLTIKGGGAVAEFGEKGHVQSNGAGSKPVGAGESINLNDGDLIAIGSTYLCIGPAQGQWPQVALPDWIALNGAPGTEPGARETRAGEGEARQARDAAETATLADSAGELTSGRPGLKRRRSRLMLLPGVVAVALLIPVFAFVNITQGRHTGTVKDAGLPDVAPADPAVALRELCAKHGLELEVANGVPKISGELNAPEDVQSVRQQALALAPNTDLAVYAKSEMLRAASAVVSGYGFPIAVKGVEDGVLSLEGWAPTEEDWERVLVDLERDVPGVQKFDGAILFLSSIQDIIGEDLRKNGLIDVQVTLANDVLECTGLMPADKQPAWLDCLANWQEEFKVIRTVKDETVLVASETPEPQTAQNMKISSILFSPLPCFITPSGQSFYEGSVLPDGNIVESIGATGVVLRRGDEVTELALFAVDQPAVDESATEEGELGGS